MNICYIIRIIFHNQDDLTVENSIPAICIRTPLLDSRKRPIFFVATSFSVKYNI